MVSKCSIVRGDNGEVLSVMIPNPTIVESTTIDAESVMGEKFKESPSNIDEAERWAKDNNLWVEDYEEGVQYLSQGGENIVYTDNVDESIVRKVNFEVDDVQEFVKSISDFNTMSPNTPYTIKGFTRLKRNHAGSASTHHGIASKGDFAVVLEQPKIDSARAISREEVSNYMKTLGFSRLRNSNDFVNEDGSINIGDIREDNLILSTDGNYHIIDAVVEIEDIQLEMENIKNRSISNGSFMKAPNGNPTNLTERQWLQVRTKNFKNWFGDWETSPETASKVVDVNGEPLVVYHSTTADRFYAFDPNKSHEKVMHFGTKEAADFRVRHIETDERIKTYATFLNIRNIVRVEDIFGEIEVTREVLKDASEAYARGETPRTDNKVELAKSYIDEGYTGNSLEWYRDVEYGVDTLDEMRDILRKQIELLEDKKPAQTSEEIDGAIYTNTEEDVGNDSYMVFNPNQIKSAIDNVGTFSSESNDIRYQKMGELGKQTQSNFKPITKRQLNQLVRGLTRAFKKAGKETKVHVGAKKMSDRLKQLAETGYNTPRMQHEYRMSHTAPTRDDGMSVSIDRLNELYPDDVYSDMGWHYYGDGDRAMDKQSHAKLRSLKGKPDAKVTIYRAVPKGVTEINDGDWITINRDYAVNHGESHIDGDYDVISLEVRADQVFTDANSLHEQGIQFLQTKDGTIYGFVDPVTGDIYMDGDLMNANTPIHEFGHLWISNVQQTNPKLWERMVNVAKQTPEWNRLANDPNYKKGQFAGKKGKALDNAIADEVWATIIGNRGENNFETILEKMNNDRSLAQKVWDAIQDFWQSVADFLYDAGIFSGYVTLPNGVRLQVSGHHGTPHQFPKELLVAHKDGTTEYLVGTVDTFPEVPEGASVVKEFPKGRFRLDNIGTGEGAQAFGWGLYFTELIDIARSYASMESDTSKQYQQYIDEVIALGNNLNPSKNFIEVLLFERGFSQYLNENDLAKVKDLLENNDINSVVDFLIGKEVFYNKTNFFELTGGLVDDIFFLEKELDKKELIDFLEQSNYFNKESLDVFKNKLIELNYQKAESFRNIYKVSLHKGKTPDQYTWLEWDKPMSDKAVGLFQKFNEEQGIKLSEPTEIGSIEDRITVDQMYKWMSDKIGQKEASLFLLDNGIDGIKYPAESISRGATSDTARGFNYVVFDENAVTIEGHIRFQQGNQNESDQSLQNPEVTAIADMALEQMMSGEFGTSNPVMDFAMQYASESELLRDTNGNVIGVKPEVLEEIRKEREQIETEARANGTFMKAPNGENTNLNKEQWVTVRTKRFKDWFGDWEGVNEYSGGDKKDLRVLKTRYEELRDSSRNNNDFNNFDTEVKKIKKVLGEFSGIDTENNYSQVLDENNEPKVVFHGSPSSDIEVFDRNPLLVTSGLKERVTYFTDNIKLATIYKNKNKKEIESRLEEIKNSPYINGSEKDKQEAIKSLEKYLKDDGKIYHVFLNIRNPKKFYGEGLDQRGWKNLSVDVGYDTKTGKPALEALAGDNDIFKNDIFDGVIGENIADKFSGEFNENVVREVVKKYTGDVYAVWKSNQIKSATDNVGTFANETNNIKFQVSVTTNNQETLNVNREDITTYETEVGSLNYITDINGDLVMVTVENPIDTVNNTPITNPLVKMPNRYRVVYDLGEMNEEALFNQSYLTNEVRDYIIKRNPELEGKDFTAQQIAQGVNVNGAISENLDTNEGYQKALEVQRKVNEGLLPWSALTPAIQSELLLETNPIVEVSEETEISSPLFESIKRLPIIDSEQALLIYQESFSTSLENWEDLDTKC